MKLLNFLALTALLGLAACGRGEGSTDASDIAGVMPDLSFNMTRANDGAAVTADSYRGKAVLLYFGYTHCPDECPTTLSNLAKALHDLGPDANRVRVLFVSVDPARDTPTILKVYVKTFAPQIDGLRGTDDQVASLARRYRVLYRVTPAKAPANVEVMHSDSTFFFDPSGRARLVTTSTDDARTISARIEQLLAS
jgi:protein SCO1/2